VLALQLDGKVAVVTGGGRGLGQAAAWALAEAGADVALLARSQDQIESTAREIEAAHRHKVLPVACDVADEASVEEAAGLVIAAFGRVDILVNNAGIAVPGDTAVDVSEEIFDRIMDVNAKGVWLGMRAVLRQRAGAQDKNRDVAQPLRAPNERTNLVSREGREHQIQTHQMWSVC
jgi:NAD(P)-dependent dehydrogenase (short-subunit alcohol dehydrogenase family)